MTTAFRFCQWTIALLGTGAYVVYGRSWRDLAHFVYDLPANLTVFAFVGQIVAEGIDRQWTWFWVSRAAMFLGMGMVAAGRDFLGWQVSGHLTCVLAVALVQTADPRLGLWERALYWAPLPIVLAIRWWLFDQGRHGQTGWAVVCAVLLASWPLVAARFTAGPSQ